VAFSPQLPVGRPLASHLQRRRKGEHVRLPHGGAEAGLERRGAEGAHRQAGVVDAVVVGDDAAALLVDGAVAADLRLGGGGRGEVSGAGTNGRLLREGRNTGEGACKDAAALLVDGAVAANLRLRAVEGKEGMGA
jgi:hypothetical protein